ncbi:MAG: hypothetical protein WC071_09780 [Victivallaceae bacterium]
MKVGKILAVVIALLISVCVNAKVDEWTAEALNVLCRTSGVNPLKMSITGSFSGVSANGDAMKQVPAVLITWHNPQGRQIKTDYFTLPKSTGQWTREINIAQPEVGVYQFRIVVVPGYKNRINIDSNSDFAIQLNRCMAAKWSGNEEIYYVRIPSNQKTPKLVSRGVKGSLTQIEPAIFELKLSGAGYWAVEGNSVFLFKSLASAKDFGDVTFNGWALPIQLEIDKYIKAHYTNTAHFKPVRLERQKFDAEPESDYLLGHYGIFNHIDWLMKNPAYSGAAPMLAYIWSINKPFNPYYLNNAIKQEFLKAEFARLEKMQSNGTFDIHGSTSNYGGGDGLMTLAHYLAFAFAAPLLDKEERELWFDGLSLLVNRFAFGRVTCENQSTHWLVNLYALYLGSGDEAYKQMAADFCANMADLQLNPTQKTGYLEEKYGPDGTYQGLAACNIAFYYRLSNDPNALKILQRIYELYNHFIVKQPDGKLVGVSGYAYRTSGSWVQRQWHGGSQYLTGVLPEAAAVDIPYKKNEASGMRNIDWNGDNGKWYENKNNLRFIKYSIDAWTPVWRYKFGVENPMQPALLPYEKKDNSIRNLGDSFTVYYGKKYYAVWYNGNSGKMYKNYFKTTGAPGSALPKEWTVTNDGKMTPTTATAKKSGWQPLFGLQMFYVPGYGMAIGAMNWNLYTHNTARIDDQTWPAIWSFNCQTKNNKLSFEHRFTNNSTAKLTREYQITVEQLKVSLSCEGKAIEQIPFVINQDDVITLSNNQFKVINAKGAGYIIAFDGAIKIVKNKISQHYLNIGTLEVYFENQLSYNIKPVNGG